MGQKSNILTLRKSQVQPNLFSENSKKFIGGFTFLNFLDKLLVNKNILLTNKELNFEGNKIFLNLSLFFRSSKILNYRRRGFNSIKKENSFYFKNIKSLFNNHFYLFDTTTVNVSFKNLNRHLDKKNLTFLYKKFKRFVGVIFSRRFNLFIDFLKITDLFVQQKITATPYLFLLGQIFKVLPKRKHNRFLVFLKLLFQIIIKSKLLSNSNNLEGIKFIVKGKLKGKTRSSSSCIQVGSVPVQSIAKNIEFSKLHVYTLYGSFGFKLWIHRK
jgi:hypothetical protein|tara:strand:- start:314 stop:1126 length:813 start_codon:yes stop_codon:yes gene_type:complete